MTAIPTLPTLTALAGPPGPPGPPEPLTTRVGRALRDGGPAPVALLGAAADDERDALFALLALQDAATGATPMISPILGAVRGRLERDLVETLENGAARRAGDPVSTVRVIAHAGAVPEIYRWVARAAPWHDLVAFLAVERVTHTTDGDDEPAPVAVRTVARDDMPTDALRVVALDGMLRTGTRDAERIGADAVAALRRPARSRHVAAALRRLHAPASVLPYHSRHGRRDPRVVQRRVADELASLAHSAGSTQAVVRGARWRDAAERRLFASLTERFVPT